MDRLVLFTDEKRRHSPELSPTPRVLGPFLAAVALVVACNSPAQPAVTAQTASVPAAPTSSAAAASPSPLGFVGTGASPSASPAVAKPSAAASPSASAVWNFDADPVGGLPTGAQVFSGQWEVRPEPDTPSQPNALCQTGQADFAAVRLDSGPYSDLTLVTHFKPIAGKEDQAGGLIFHVQDMDNYYIVRGNALENNVIFFVYIDARRSQLKAANAPVKSGVWHELRVDVHGNTFAAYLDGSRVVDVADNRYATGGIGLWTKSDSETCFDDVALTRV